MSQENVELVRRTFEAWNAKDQATWLDAFDPEVQWRPAISGGEPAVGMELLAGHSELRTFWDDLREVHEDFFIRADDIRDLDELVLVIGATIGRGRVGRVEFESPHAWVVQVHGGKILRMDTYTDPDEALEAVGLRE